MRRHLTELSALAAASGATDIPHSYTELARGATRRALASHRIGDTAAQALLDALDGASGESPAERKTQ